MNRYYIWKLQFVICKCLQSLQNNITHALGGNISLPNKIPLVLPFEGFPPMTKQVTNSFFYIKLYTLSFRGVTTVIIQRTRNDWIIQYEYVPWLTHHGNIPSSRRQSETKYEPAIWMGSHLKIITIKCTIMVWIMTQGIPLPQNTISDFMKISIFPTEHMY